MLAIPAARKRIAKIARIAIGAILILERMRNTVIEITATGIEALTVSPTFKTKYSDDAPNTIPSSVPMISGSGVNSRKRTLAGMYGRKLARNGFAGLALTLSLDISYNIQRVWQNGETAGKTGLLYTRALSEGKHVAEWRFPADLRPAIPC